MIDVVRVGALTTVQDCGRVGWAHLGVPRSGALDQPALRRANRLVGNDDACAGLEITLAGCVLKPRVASVLAVTGAAAAVTVDGASVPFGEAIEVPAGASLKIGPARTGVRTYLAVRGGVDVPITLGSRSTDTLSGLGPPPLQPGDTLPVGSDCRAVGADLGVQPDGGPVRLWRGPRDDWFDDASWDRLCSSEYTVSMHSNRVGARLAGAALARTNTDELPSEGIVLGAVQITPDGQPLVFLADHPTTGGYPVIGVVDAADLPVLAQARPGSTVRFDGSQR